MDVCGKNGSGSLLRLIARWHRSKRLERYRRDREGGEQTYHGQNSKTPGRGSEHASIMRPSERERNVKMWKRLGYVMMGS